MHKLLTILILLVICSSCNNGKDSSLSGNALEFYKKAANGDSEAMNNLGDCYYNGEGGAYPNHEKAVYWYKKAAKKGNPGGQCNLGKCFENGKVVKQDFKKAAKLYRRAAEQGYAEAQYRLGCCFENNESEKEWFIRQNQEKNKFGLKHDPEQAFWWYREAAKNGYAEAQYKLGEIYSSSYESEKYGVSENTEYAKDWFRKAAEQGHEGAKKKLETQLAEETPSVPPKTTPSPPTNINPKTTTTFTVNGVSFTMVAVEGGTFTMGATAELVGEADPDEKPAHQVTLSSFHIGQTEVTQELWKAVMGNNPSYFTGANRPVECVSWNNCQEFLRKLNDLTNNSFRLPTEAEWEYAARGGNKSRGYKYSGSNNCNEVAWYGAKNKDSGETHNVRSKKANELDLYDMSGNVWEWCGDWYNKYYYSESPMYNPTGPSYGKKRVNRGGGWYMSFKGCRVSYRDINVPSECHERLGLRLAL